MSRPEPNELPSDGFKRVGAYNVMRQTETYLAQHPRKRRNVEIERHANFMNAGVSRPPLVVQECLVDRNSWRFPTEPLEDRGRRKLGDHHSGGNVIDRQILLRSPPVAVQDVSWPNGLVSVLPIEPKSGAGMAEHSVQTDSFKLPGGVLACSAGRSQKHHRLRQLIWCNVAAEPSRHHMFSCQWGLRAITIDASSYVLKWRRHAFDRTHY